MYTLMGPSLSDHVWSHRAISDSSSAFTNICQETGTVDRMDVTDVVLQVDHSMD